MAFHHGHTHSEPAKMEQIITEFFAKSLHIILESRCPYVSSRNTGDQVLSSPSPSSSSSSSSSFRPRDKWFNLALRDCPAALENIDFWRQSNLEPMIVDVILMQRPNDWDPLNLSLTGLGCNLSRKERDYLDNDELGFEAKSEKIIERWVLKYESKKSGGDRGGSSVSKRSSSTSSHALYKKSILLLRSLYATVRLLPAYKLFHDLISTAHIRLYNLGNRVSSFAEPFTLREEADMHRFVFTPIETSFGKLCLSVLYRSSVMDVGSEPSTPISPQIIPEYVLSPMAKPLKRLPSGLASHISRSSSPFGRRHSWSYDLYRASPPSMYPSPSPTYESHVKHCIPPAGLPRHVHDETAAAHNKNLSYDECWISTMFSPSPSPSPSPPTYVSDSQISKPVLLSESAPISIPASRLSSMPSLPNKQLVHPSPPMKATRLNVFKKVTNFGLQQTTSTVDKLFSFSNDESGKMLVVKPSSHSSPSKSFSRSSSRLSFQDDYDISEYSGPFSVDDDDMIDPGFRPGSFDLQGHPSGLHKPGEVFPVKKSQDAAVGALVLMLKKAPPLCQDIPVTTQYVHGSKLQTLRNYMQKGNEKSNSKEQTIGVQQSSGLNLASSGLIASKTTADALDELRGYREMKDLLLSKEGKSSQA